jgi:hypothetical protein
MTRTPFRRRFFARLAPVFDLLLPLLVWPAARLLKAVRFYGLIRLPRTRNLLLTIGLLPVRDHYYEPAFDFRHPRVPFTTDRSLPGVDWNEPGQLALLDRFVYARELDGLPREPQDARMSFYLNNGAFGPGDAEIWYQMIRAVKPRRIVEIGSGNSTLLAIRAVSRNTQEDPSYRCDHVCVEPYEMPWLEETGVRIVRRKVEDLGVGFFSGLGENDILFIDSSHVIRPQGDVLFEYLELLPALAPGVIVHVHDIFSPRDYLPAWLQEDIRLWNEQYLLEAFLSHNTSWKILAALNFLRHHHADRLNAVAPYVDEGAEPGSFYLQRVR